jgi:hypothetical protein
VVTEYPWRAVRDGASISGVIPRHRTTFTVPARRRGMLDAGIRRRHHLEVLGEKNPDAPEPTTSDEPSAPGNGSTRRSPGPA